MKVARPFREMDVIPIDKIETTIMIPISKYEELLTIKGKYEELKENQKDLVNLLLDKYSEGKITINQIREILGFKPIKTSLKYHQKS